MQEVDSSVLAQATMRSMGRYELGWLQALVAQDAPGQAPKLAFAPPRDDDEGTQGGIFIGELPMPRAVWWLILVCLELLRPVALLWMPSV